MTVRFLDRGTVAAAIRRLPLRGRAALLADRAATRIQRHVRAQPKYLLEEPRAIAKQQWRRVVRIDQPLVLITQIHRSGGTLLMRLFDSHPELYAIPHELGPIIPADPVPTAYPAVWRALHDRDKMASRFKRGLRQQNSRLNRDESEAPFLLLPSVHGSILVRNLREHDAPTERDAVDAYLTGYFNAWLNYRGGLDPAKKWVTGFESAMIAQPKRMERYRAVYPDGRVISILRDPASWWASARRWEPRYERLDVALMLWEESALAAERQADLLLDFEALTSRTAETMAGVAAFLGIEMRDELLTPTVNGVPFGANSSFASAEPGVVDAQRDRSSTLTEDERAQIEGAVGETYRRVRERCLPFGA